MCLSGVMSAQVRVGFGPQSLEKRKGSLLTSAMNLENGHSQRKLASEMMSHS